MLKCSGDFFFSFNIFFVKVQTVTTGTIEKRNTTSARNEVYLKLGNFRIRVCFNTKIDIVSIGFLGCNLITAHLF